MFLKKIQGMTQKKQKDRLKYKFLQKSLPKESLRKQK